MNDTARFHVKLYLLGESVMDMLSKDNSFVKEKISIYNALKDIRQYISIIEKETITKEDLYNCIVENLDAIIDELSKNTTYSSQIQIKDLIESDSYCGPLESQAIMHNSDYYVNSASLERKLENLELNGENNNTYTLNQLLGTGGEGSVYSIKEQTNFAIKIYRDTIQESRKEEKLRHIRAFRNNNIRGIDENGEMLATIPEELIFFSDGSFAGFKMRKVIDCIPLINVLRGTYSNLKEKRFKIAYHFARTIRFLHEQGIVLGDMNPNNFVVDRNDNVISTDCDSFQLTDCITKEHFKCHVAVRELLAPEILMMNNLEDLSNYSDLFSMAILLFRILMDNYDPFGQYIVEKDSAIYEDDWSAPWNSAGINNRSLFIKNVEGYSLPKGAPKFSNLPIEIQQLFIRAFDYDQQDADKIKKLRPSAVEWENVLRKNYEAERYFLLDESSDPEKRLLLSKIFLSNMVFRTERGIQGFSIKGNDEYIAIIFRYDNDFPVYAIKNMTHNNPENSLLLWPGYRLFEDDERKQCIGYLTEKPKFKGELISLYDFIRINCDISQSLSFNNSLEKRKLVSLNIAKCFQSMHTTKYRFKAIDTKDFLVDEEGRVFYTATSMLCDSKSNKGMWKYLAPESIQYLGNEVSKYTEETDNYLMTLLIFEVLTGQFPFSRMEQYERNVETYYDDILDGKTIYYYNDEKIINQIKETVKSCSEEIEVVFRKTFNYWEDTEVDIYRPNPQELIDILSKGIKRNVS